MPGQATVALLATAIGQVGQVGQVDENLSGAACRESRGSPVVVTPSARRQSASLFRRRLRTALIRDSEADFEFIERVAVLSAAGYRKGEITRVLSCSPAQLRDALDRLRRIAPDLEIPAPE